MAKGLRYSEFADRLDIAAFEEAIGFEPNETRKGNDIGYCPDPWGLHKHGDSTGKFAIHRDKLVYNCWVCGGGSILSLAMAVKDMDAETATEWIYQFTRENAESGEDFLADIDEILFHEEEKEPPLPYFNERVLLRWDSPPMEWLHDRGIPLVTGQKFKLRYAKDAIKYAPKKQGIPIDDNYVGPAIIFPHYWEGRLVGWQSRWLNEDRPKWCAKYTNTPDFPKQETLFNYDEVRFTHGRVIIVESVPTVLRLNALGHPAVATFGSSVDERQMKLLRCFQGGAILAPDNDKAGLKWLVKLADYLERYIPVTYVGPFHNPDSGHDLGDLSDRAISEAVRHPFPVT